MLILRRKIGQSVMIGETDPIEVCVIDTRGGHIRLGFIADKDTAVNRKEIYEAKKANGQLS